MLDSPRSAVARDSKTALASCYGPDGPRIESQLGRNSPHPSKPVLGPTQLPIQYVPGLTRLGRDVDHLTLLARRFKKE